MQSNFVFFIFLQTMLKSAGCQMKHTVFLLTDTQIKEESFLEDVDSLLNTGEVPNLFAVDEKAELNEVMQLSSHKKSMWGICQCIVVKFTLLIRDHLHTEVVIKTVCESLISLQTLI